jgi:hypothetical protein
MDNKDSLYKCNICIKEYSSYKSLWNHNKKFHLINNVIHENDTKNDTKIDTKNDTKNNTKIIKCSFCNKIFNFRQNKYQHEKRCKNKETIINDETNKKKIEILEKELKSIKTKLNKNKINKKELIINNNNNNNNNNNINNGTINNITINAIGKESITNLTDLEIKMIVENNNYMSDIIKYLNFNKRLPQNHIFCVSSLEGDYATYYNHKTKQPEKINKKELFDKLVVNSFEKLNNIMLYLEISKDIKELINEEKIESIINKLEKNKLTFYTNKNRKKNYDHNINELGYNNKKLIMDTWSKLPNNLVEEPKDIDKETEDIEEDSVILFYDSSSSDDSSDDSSDNDN